MPVWEGVTIAVADLGVTAALHRWIRAHFGTATGADNPLFAIVAVLYGPALPTIAFRATKI